MKYDLFDLRVLDAPRDSAFDSLAWLSTEVLSVPSTLLSVLDLPRGRQHVRAQVGLTCVAANEPDLPLRHSLAHRVCALNQVVAIDDTAQDPEAANSPVIVNSGGKAYIGAPVHGPDHRPLGALEAIAPKPREWTPVDQDKLAALASYASQTILLRASLETIKIMNRSQQ